MNDKITCGVVRDLIPLVTDEVCGEESRRAVEEHVKTCDECAKILAEARAALPAPLTDEKTAADFQRVLRKGGRRFRLWRIVAAVLAAVLLIVSVEVGAHPEILYNIRTEVPVSWMENAHLVRTEQGAILLQFTPDARYRRFFGQTSGGTVWDEAQQQVEAYQLSYGYPWLAKLLNRDIDNEKYTSQYGIIDYYVIHLTNGDWALAFPAAWQANFVWHEDRIWGITEAALTRAEIEKLLAEGVPVDGNMKIVQPVDPWPEDVIMQLKGPDGLVTLYQAGDEIPLCDEETQAKFDVLADIFSYYFHEPGELIHYEENEGENRRIEYTIKP